MKNRIICLLLVMSFVLSAFFGISVSATPINDSINSKAELLTVLGIIDGLPEEKAYANPVSRREFAVYTAKMLGIDVYAINPNRYYQDMSESDISWNAVASLLERGILTMNETRTFRPSDIITRDEAVCMMMKVLGATGFDYATTLTLAENTDVVKGIPYRNLEYGDVIKILHNTLNSHIYNYTATTNDFFSIEPGAKTFLEAYYDIKYAEGIVTSVNKTSLDGVSMAGTGSVCVDGTVINVNLTDPYFYLGSYVGAYYTDINDDYELVYLTVKENKTERLVISFDDFSGFDKTTYDISYYDGNKKLKAGIDKSVTIIKNGEADSKNVSTAFDDISNGEIILIDADKKGGYETVFINSYYNVVVSYVDTDSKMIYGTNGDNIDFGDSSKTNIITMADGTAKNPEEISVGNTISVYSSDKLNRLVVSANTVTGEISYVSHENDLTYVTLGGSKYALDKEFADTNADMIKVSKNVSAYIDAFGKIAEMVIDGTKGGMYSYIVELTVTGGVDEKVKMMLYTENGELITLPLSSKVKIDGEICKNEDEVKTALASETKDYKNQIAYIYLNADKTQIRSIDTVAEGSEQNGLYVTSPMEEYPFFSGQMVLGPLIHINSATKLFIVPKSEVYKADSNAYQVVKGNTFFKDFEKYQIEGYATGNKNNPQYTEVMLYKDDLLGINGTKLSHINVFIISGVSRAYDEETGEIKQQIELVSGKTKLSFYGAENLNIEEHPYVLEGNVVKIKTNFKNQISEITELIYGEMKDGTRVTASDKNVASKDRWGDKDKYVVGYVTSVKNGLVGISEEKNKPPFLLGAVNGKPIAVYDPTMRNKVFSGGENDLIDAMNNDYKVVVDISRGNIRTYSVIKVKVEEKQNQNGD